MNAAALFRVVESGDLTRVRRFLENNPDIEVDALDQSRYTPLLTAITHTRKTIVELLLAHGAAVNGPVGAPVTPLQRACNSGKSRHRVTITRARC